jgi:hypothetical protein
MNISGKATKAPLSHNVVNHACDETEPKIVRDNDTKIKLEALLLAIQHVRISLSLYMENDAQYREDVDGVQNALSNANQTDVKEFSWFESDISLSEYFKFHIALLNTTDRMIHEGLYDDAYLEWVTSFLSRFDIKFKGGNERR